MSYTHPNPSPPKTPKFTDPPPKNVRRRGAARSDVGIDRSDSPRHPRPSLLLPPTASPPIEAAVLQPPLRHDRLRPHPPHLLHGRLWNRLRRHRGAAGHRIHAGPPHRGGPARCVHAGSGQRPVHHRGAIVGVHVRPRRNRDRAVGSRSG